MGLLDEIKREADGNRTKLNSTEEQEVEKVLNSLFYLDKNIDEELKFLKSVMTRGQESQERKGLHASAIIVSDDKFCYRQQVLSLFYKQLQGEQNSADLMRIFEEGNAIHEKWQRLFIRGGLCKPLDCDFSLFSDEFDLSYTPDIKMAKIGNKQYIIEIKSVNTFQFKKMKSHPSGRKQLQLYMYLTGIHNGIVLCEDKNTQQFKVFCYEFNYDEVKQYIARLEKIQYFKQRLLKKGKLVKRHKGCTGYSCKMAGSCAMRDVCYGRKKERLS